MKKLASYLTRFSVVVSLKKVLLLSGILSSVLYVTSDILASWQYDSYSYADQTYSELLASGAEVTSHGSLHSTMTAVMSLFILLSIGFGAFLLGRRFKLYSFATIVILLIFGILTGFRAPQLAAGQSTPWMGLTERINIYATMLWFAVLAIILLRSEQEQNSH